MNKRRIEQQIEQLIDKQAASNGPLETPIKGVQLFKLTTPIQCAPAVYEPSVTAIVRGGKEAIWNGDKHFYDESEYIGCTMSMPIETGTPSTSPENPLIGVYITLDTRLMTEIVLAMESTGGRTQRQNQTHCPQGITTAPWDEPFSDALYRLLQLADKPADRAILEKSRLRELYYAILTGAAGNSFKRAFGVGNAIARSIEYLSTHLTENVTIEQLADQIGMSRAVFHRKFKQATNMTPIQFVKSMRLNHAAMKITEGTNVNVAAMEVGYASSSQFSREFRRMYGLSPKHWRQTQVPNPEQTLNPA